MLKTNTLYFQKHYKGVYITWSFIFGWQRSHLYDKESLGTGHKVYPGRDRRKFQIFTKDFRSPPIEP